MPDFAFHANPDFGLMHGFSFSKTSIIVIAKTLTKICSKDGFLFKEDTAVALKRDLFGKLLACTLLFFIEIKI